AGADHIGAFFAHHGVVWPDFEQPLGDELLGPTVQIRDQVGLGRLVIHRGPVPLEGLEQVTTDLGGDRLGDRQQLRGGHERPLRAAVGSPDSTIEFHSPMARSTSTATIPTPPAANTAPHRPPRPAMSPAAATLRTVTFLPSSPPPPPVPPTAA